MKFELTDQDRNYIETINKANANGEAIPLFVSDPGSTYYIGFNVTDIARANAFAMTLMNSHEDMIKMLDDECGISVSEIRYKNPGLTAVQNTIDILENTIAQLKAQL